MQIQYFFSIYPQNIRKNHNLSYRAQSPGERVHQIGPNIQLLHFSHIEQLSSEYLCPTLRASVPHTSEWIKVYYSQVVAGSWYMQEMGVTVYICTGLNTVNSHCVH